MRYFPAEILIDDSLTEETPSFLCDSSPEALNVRGYVDSVGDYEVSRGDDWFPLVQNSTAKYILVSLAPGMGKSHQIAGIQRDGRVIYCSQQPDKHPTITVQ